MGSHKDHKGHKDHRRRTQVFHNRPTCGCCAFSGYGFHSRSSWRSLCHRFNPGTAYAQKLIILALSRFFCLFSNLSIFTDIAMNMPGDTEARIEDDVGVQADG
jgi:hypothetical protein